MTICYGIFIPERHGQTDKRTDRRADRRTELLYQYRASAIEFTFPSVCLSETRVTVLKWRIFIQNLFIAYGTP